MFKKILMLSLILNTPYVLPTGSFIDPQYNLAAIGTICVAAGVICASLTYQDFKKLASDTEEYNRHLTILKEMGVKVMKASKNNLEGGLGSISIVTKEHLTMETPSHFSQEEVKKAKEHFNLLLTYRKRIDDPRVWPVAGSLFLLPTGIWHLWELLKALV